MHIYEEEIEKLKNKCASLENELEGLRKSVIDKEQNLELLIEDLELKSDKDLELKSDKASILDYTESQLLKCKFVIGLMVFMFVVLLVWK